MTGEIETSQSGSGFRNHFWQFNIGHALTIIMVLVAGLGAWFKMDARLTAVELLAAHTSQRIEMVDSSGTRKSQEGITSETATINSNTNRISALEKNMAEISPKLERIDVNLQWIIKKNGGPN